MMFKCLCLLALLCVAEGLEIPLKDLKEMTNELNEKVLRFYSDLPNKITDFALEGIRDYLNENNDTKINIPTVDVGFKENFLGVDFDGEFTAYNGIFTNPATIVRKGNSTISHNGFLHYNISTIVGFTDMEVYFPRYDASIIGIHEQGDVKVIIGQNEIYLKVTVSLLPKCTVSLTSLKLRQFTDIATYLTGLGYLDWLADDITGWILSSYETSFTDLIENVVANKLSEVLAKTGGFCKYKTRRLKTANGPSYKISCSKVKPFFIKCQLS